MIWRVVGIDPGVRCSGVAELENDRVVNVWPLERRSTTLSANITQQCQDLAAALGASLSGYDVVAVELPTVYPGSPVRPSDLIEIAAVAGALAATVPADLIEIVEPRRWKGSVPKDVHNRRMIEKMPELRELLGQYKRQLHEHMVDAAGLARWASGRF